MARKLSNANGGAGGFACEYGQVILVQSMDQVSNSKGVY
jgi:hypothetical protein